MRPVLWDHRWFGAAAAADGYPIAGEEDAAHRLERRRKVYGVAKGVN
jgi:hypothetical protein